MNRTTSPAVIAFATALLLTPRAVLHAVETVPPPPRETVNGPFKPDDASLKQYQCPDWFRDAKLGIWAVWGPESVPMQGDWYARRLTRSLTRSRLVRHDTTPSSEHYGHPSTFGFKDIIPLWKAEKWDPDRLMALYKKAGAKYFCMIAEHHDNFDCWNSKFQQMELASTWGRSATSPASGSRPRRNKACDSA